MQMPVFLVGPRVATPPRAGDGQVSGCAPGAKPLNSIWVNRASSMSLTPMHAFGCTKNVIQRTVAHPGHRQL